MSMRRIIGGLDRFSFVQRESGEKWLPKGVRYPRRRSHAPSTFSPTLLFLVTFPRHRFSFTVVPSEPLVLGRAPWEGNSTRHGLLIPVDDPGLVTVLYLGCAFANAQTAGISMD